MPSLVNCGAGGHGSLTELAPLADALLGGPATTLLPVESVDSPFWGCYRLWGFEELMVAVARSPGLVQHACARILAQEIAAGGLTLVEQQLMWGEIWALCRPGARQQG